MGRPQLRSPPPGPADRTRDHPRRVMPISAGPPGRKHPRPSQEKSSPVPAVLAAPVVTAAPVVPASGGGLVMADPSAAAASGPDPRRRPVLVIIAIAQL